MGFDRMFNPYAARARFGQNEAFDPNAPVLDAQGYPGMPSGSGGGMAPPGMQNQGMAFNQSRMGRGLGWAREGQWAGVEVPLCPSVDVCPPTGPVCITAEADKCVDPCEVKLIRIRPDCAMLVEDFTVSKSVKHFEIVDARIGCVSLTTGDDISGRVLIRDSDDDQHDGHRRHHRRHCSIIRGIAISNQHPLVLKVFNKSDDTERFKIKLFGRIVGGW